MMFKCENPRCNKRIKVPKKIRNGTFYYCSKKCAGEE